MWLEGLFQASFFSINLYLYINLYLCINVNIPLSTITVAIMIKQSGYSKLRFFFHTDIQFCQFIKYSFLVLLLLTCQIKVYLIFFSIFTCKSKITSSTFPMGIMILLGMSIR